MRTRRKIGTGIALALGLGVGALIVSWYTLCEFGTGGHCWEYVRRSLF